jgi:hypothetical protein
MRAFNIANTKEILYKNKVIIQISTNLSQINLSPIPSTYVVLISLNIFLPYVSRSSKCPLCKLTASIPCFSRHSLLDVITLTVGEMYWLFNIDMNRNNIPGVGLQFRENWSSWSSMGEEYHHTNTSNYAILQQKPEKGAIRNKSTTSDLTSIGRTVEPTA